MEASAASLLLVAMIQSLQWVWVSEVEGLVWDVVLFLPATIFVMPQQSPRRQEL